MFGTSERNAHSGGQGGGWGSLGRCWGTAVLSTAWAPVEQAGVCPWGQRFITQMRSEGGDVLLPFTLESPSLNDFLPLLQKGQLQATVKHLPPSLPQTHLSFHGALEIRPLSSVVVVVKKHASREWAPWTPWVLRVWRKVAVGYVYEVFAVYLRGWLIEGGFHVSFDSKPHPIVQAVF